jgi:hypothetical protein
LFVWRNIRARNTNVVTHVPQESGDDVYLCAGHGTLCEDPTFDDVLILLADVPNAGLHYEGTEVVIWYNIFHQPMYLPNAFDEESVLSTTANSFH